MISQNPASPNGTRARILILLTKNGPMTTAEIAEALGLTPKQVRDNSNQARYESANDVHHAADIDIERALPRCRVDFPA